jgi:dihydroorotase
MNRFLPWYILILGILFSVPGLRAQQYDLLLKGGHLLDAKNGIDGLMDIAIDDGKIAQVARDIPAGEARRLINVTGLYVTPGLIDMHGHAFMGNDLEAYIANGPTSVMPDGFTFRSGVTTLVDAGSSGWRNFPLFKKQTIDRSQTRILAFLNIVGNGMTSRFAEQDLTDMNSEMSAYCITELYPEILVGIKAAHFWGGFEQVDRAVAAGKMAGVPVMVDFGEHRPPNSIEALFMEHLRPGDIFTHTYSDGPEERETVVDAKGRLKPFILKAQERGIVFDLGHGGGAFTWKQAVPAVEQGFVADVISTDLHTQSMNSGMKDLGNVMSKMMALGIPLREVVRKTTWVPANVIHRPDLGHLSVGAVADVAVFSLRSGHFGFLDVRRLRYPGKARLETELTLREGNVVWDLNGLAANGFEK